MPVAASGRHFDMTGTSARTNQTTATTVMAKASNPHTTLGSSGARNGRCGGRDGLGGFGATGACGVVDGAPGSELLPANRRPTAPATAITPDHTSLAPRPTPRPILGATGPARAARTSPTRPTTAIGTPSTTTHAALGLDAGCSRASRSRSRSCTSATTAAASGNSTNSRGPAGRTATRRTGSFNRSASSSTATSPRAARPMLRAAWRNEAGTAPSHTPRAHASPATNQASVAVDVAVVPADVHGWRAAVAPDPGIDRLLTNPAVSAAPTTTSGASTVTRRRSLHPKRADQPDTTAATIAGMAKAR